MVFVFGSVKVYRGPQPDSDLTKLLVEGCLKTTVHSALPYKRKKSLISGHSASHTAGQETNPLPPAMSNRRQGAALSRFTPYTVTVCSLWGLPHVTGAEVVALGALDCYEYWRSVTLERFWTLQPTPT